MLRSEVREELLAARGEGWALFPAYEDYCVGNVPDTVSSLLDVGGGRPLPDDVFEGVRTDVERVVLVLIDGLGLDSWRRDRERVPLLDSLTDGTTVTPLTSVYPSSTAAAVTTLETGQLPCEHGRVGWNVYDPASDRSFLALSGEVKHDPTGTCPTVTVPTGDEVPVTEEAFEGIDYHYDDLAAAGVDCHRLQPFDSRAGEGATQHVYDGLDEFGGQLAGLVETSDAPSYVYAYLPQVDTVSHDSGTGGPAFEETLAAVCNQVSGAFEGLDDGTASETLVLVTADHGHVNTDPERNVDLDAMPDLIDALGRHSDGEPVRLSGSPRNLHLHVRDGKLPEAQRALSELDVRTFTREEALERGLFGDRPASDRFRRRCGDLVVTHRDLATWFGDHEPEKLEYVGMHGGLHPDEMLVPFAAVRADRLV